MTKISNSLVNHKVVKYGSAAVNQKPNDTALLLPQFERPASPRQESDRMCLNRVAFVVWIIFVLGTCCIALGTNYYNECPAMKMLPVSLIIFGGNLVVASLLSCLCGCINVYNIRNCYDVSRGQMVLFLLFVLVSIGMVMNLCYWILSMDPTTKPEDRNLENYCDNNLFGISKYLVGLLLVPISCVILCIPCFIFAKPNPDNFQSIYDTM